MIVADTDFLSAFLKIGEIELVSEIFDEEEIKAPIQVEEELVQELEKELDDRIETVETEPIKDETLGKGERAAISLTEEEDILLTNRQKSSCKSTETVKKK